MITLHLIVFVVVPGTLLWLTSLAGFLLELLASRPAVRSGGRWLILGALVGMGLLHLLAVLLGLLPPDLAISGIMLYGSWCLLLVTGRKLLISRPGGQ